MNRRAFFKTLGATVAAAFVTKAVPLRWKSKLWISPMYPQDIWFSDVNVPHNTIYFLNRDGVNAFNGQPRL